MDQTELDYPQPDGQNDSCNSNPDFAVICSFISLFGDKIDLELNIEQLKNSIEDQTNLDESLVELHVKLLKKIRRYFLRDQWEKALIRFASEYSYEDACEIGQLGYQKTRPSVKLQLLRRLLDAQFECDQKFKASVNLCEANELRILPIGRDIKGNSYWQRSDTDGNLRVFQEEPLNYKSWKTVCQTPEELNQLINDLEQIKNDRIKGEPMQDPYNPLPEIFPDFFQKEEEKIDEVQTENGKVNNRRTKKSRNRGRSKKSSLLAVLKEADEENIDDQSRDHDSNDQQNRVKSPPEPVHSHINMSTKVPSSPENGSIESQVKLTLESLINKVVSSFEYILKPLSRNFSDNVKKEDETKATAVKSQKRQTKRDKPKFEELPRRSSSRIQQLQQKKEEEEMKKLIESSASKIESSQIDQKSRSSRDNDKRRSDSSEEGSKKGRQQRKEGQRWRRGKGKKKLSWDKDDSDLSSTSSLTDSNEDDLEETDDAFKFGNNDEDEFACEDEDINNEPVIVKRARTARQAIEVDGTGELNTSSALEEDKPCGRCDKSNDPEWILLCDMCDDGFHTTCCIPPLMIVPDGDWFCPSCEHKMLLIKLRELYTSITELLAAKERERQKRQRLRQNAKKESAKTAARDEILPEKRQRDFLHELNQPIALQALDEELNEFSADLPRSPKERVVGRSKKKGSKSKKSSRGRRFYSQDDDDDDFSFTRRPRKTYSRRNISESDETDDIESFDESLSESSEHVRPKTRKARACVSYRFQEYDELIKSAIRGDSEDEEAEGNKERSTPEKCNYGRGKDMATIEALAYQQENGLLDSGNAEPTSDPTVVPQQKTKSRKKGRRLNDLDADSEIDSATSDESFQASCATEEEEEEDDDDITEIESVDDSSIDEIISNKCSKSKSRRNKRINYDSDSSDYEPRTRRAAAKRVSYKESTDEEDFISEPRRVKKNVLSSDNESEASWKSPAKSDLDDDDDNEDEDVDEGNDDHDAKSTSFLESGDEIASNIELSQPKQEKVEENIPVNKEASTKPNDQEVNNGSEIPVAKRIRLEKRETRPVYNINLMNESFDEIAVPLAPVQPLNTTLPPRPALLPQTPQPSRPSQSPRPSQPPCPSQPPRPSQHPQPPQAPPPGPHHTLLPPRAPVHSQPPYPPRLLAPPQPPTIHAPPHPHYTPQPLPHLHPSPYPPLPPHVPNSHNPYIPHPPPRPPAPYMMGQPLVNNITAPPHMVRDPIHELNQYCSGSSYPTNIFSSFNISLPPKNLSPPHRPFYEEDEVRPTSTSSNDKQKTW